MNAARSTPLVRHRFAWLLWLALLLPLAQGAAAWHALSHARADLAGEADGKALHAAHCDLCLTASALATGAPTGPSASMPGPTARHAPPPPPPAGVVSAVPTPSYRSRAPPFASH